MCICRKVRHNGFLLSKYKEFTFYLVYVMTVRVLIIKNKHVLAEKVLFDTTDASRSGVSE